MQDRGFFLLDKVTIKFLADLMYVKGLLFYEEITDIYEARTPEDLDNIVDKMLRGEYNVYKRGETYYIGSGDGGGTE